MKRSSVAITKPKKPKVRSVISYRNEADRLAAGACKSIERCEAEGFHDVKCSGRLEWAHVWSRGILHLRHDPQNCFCLCWAHHKYYTTRGNKWFEFVESVRKGTWDYLNEKDNERRDCKVKIPLKEIYGEWIELFKKGSK